MNDILINAGIAIGGIIIGAVLNTVLPGSKTEQFFVSKRRRVLVGDYRSEWGPLPHGPVKHHEDLKITRQRGSDIWGTATRHEQNDKKWDVRGRYDGQQFLQLYYFPSRDSKNPDFLDYGCYFLKKKADGSFAGISTGFGKSEEDITIDYHELKRVK